MYTHVCVFYFVQPVYMPAFVPVLYYFEYNSFIIYFKTFRTTLALFSLLRIALDTWGLFQIHMQFRIDFSTSVKNVVGILIGTGLNLEIAFGYVYTYIKGP